MWSLKRNRLFSSLVSAVAGLIGLSLYADYTPMDFMACVSEASGGNNSSACTWVRTDYTPACTDRIEMKVRFLDYTDANTQCLFCSRENGMNNSVTAFFINNSGMKIRYDRGASGKSTYSTKVFTSAADGSVDHVIIWDGKDKKGYVDASSVNLDATATTYTPGSPMALFASHTAGTGLNASTTVGNNARYRFYWCRVYNQDGKLMRNFVPAKDNSKTAGASNEGGVYDTVTGQFFVNNGTKSFNFTGATAAAANHTLTFSGENGTVSVNGAAGTATGSVTVPWSTNLSLVATPAEGYTFCRWEGDTQYISSGSSTSSAITVSSEQNITLTAVYDVAVAKYARYSGGAFNYLSAAKGSVPAPEGGMNSDITILFSSDADYQALKTVSTEVAKAKGLELDANIKLTADTDWSALDYSLGGNAIDINGKHFTTGSLSGNGGITSEGNLLANGTFEANGIASGAYVTMTPNGWKSSGSVILVKNHSTYSGKQCNGSTWCMIWKGGYITREITIVQDGDYNFKFDVAARNQGNSYWSSQFYMGFDGGVSMKQNITTGWTNTKSCTVALKAGTHTMKIGCDSGSCIVFDNVYLWKDNNSSMTGILEVKVPEGKTVTNDTVTLGGGQALQLWKTGKGTLVMNKTNNGYGSPFGYVANVVKEGVMRKSSTVGNASCGSQYASIKVEDGGTFDLKGRTYWDYQYILNGHGHDGKGALINTVSADSPWANGNYGYLRNVELGSDTTISGTTPFSMSFWQHGAITMTMNDHTLHFGGTTIYFGSMNYAGKGRIVIVRGCTMEVYPKSPTASGCTLEVNGQLQHHGYAFSSLSNLIFTATGTYTSPWEEVSSLPLFTVLDTYAPNVNTVTGSKSTHPKVALGTAASLYTTLDLSLFSSAFDASTTTFCTGSSVTVEFGSRTLTDNQKVVSWSAIPNVSEFVGHGENFGDFRLQARADGLYAVAAPTYATWDVINECWNFFKANGEPYTAEWTAGVTDKIDVHFSSIEEFNAIKTQSVTPAKYVLTKLVLPAGSSLYDFTDGFDFAIPPNTVIDLKGNRLKLPNANLSGTVPFTVTDTSAAVAPAIVRSSACFWLDAMDISTMTLSGNSVQKWTSKDANHVVATATSAPTYKVYANGSRVIPTVDFGGIGSNLDMSYPRFTKLRTVFWVMKIVKNSGAFFLGDMTTYNFHRGSAGQYGNGSYHKYASMWKGTTAVNITGDYPPDNEFQVYSATMSIDACSERLTTDRACVDNGVTRTGGRQLSELICFETVLADADRRAVIDYLQQKWFGGEGVHGELIAEVPEGQSVSLNNVTITGNARLVKSGVGTLIANKASQIYAGGTLIEGGKLTMGNNSCFGAANSEVTVDAGAVLEVNGKGDIYNYTYVLNGGTMQNTTGTDVGSGTAQIQRMRLTADSTFKPSNSYGFIGPSYTAATLNLGGHTLTVPVGGGKNFWLFNTTVTEGTIDLTSGGWLVLDKTALNAPNTTFRVNCAINVAASTDNAPFTSTMGSYVARYAADYNAGAGVINVKQMFKPCSAYYHGAALANGVTLDLSAFDGVFTGTSSFKDAAKTVTYPVGTEEAPATVNVELHGRALHGSKIIGWDAAAAPSNIVFQATERTKKDGRMLVTKDDGVYVVGGTVLFLR